MVEFECVITWHTLYDAKWSHQNCTHATVIAIPHGSPLMLIFIKCTKRYHVGFGRTGSTLILVHVCIWMYHYLVYDAPRMTRSQLCPRLLFTDNGDDIHTVLRWFWLYIYGTVSCWRWMHRQYVLIGESVNFNFVSSLSIRYNMNDIIAIVHSGIHYNDNDCWLRADVDVDWIYEMVSCRFWPNRKYVEIGTHLNLNMPLHLHYDAILIAYSSPAIQIHYNGDGIYGSARMLIEHMERCHVGFGRTESTLVSIRVWIWMCHYLVYDAPWHHHNCVLANYNDNDIRLCADVDWTYATVSCPRCWPNSKYVIICACVNLNVQLLMQHQNIIIGHSPAMQTHYNCTVHGSALMLIEYMERYRFGFGRTESTLALVHVWI